MPAPKDLFACCLVKDHGDSKDHGDRFLIPPAMITPVIERRKFLFDCR